MRLEFPYQIVTFIGKEPELNEPVYAGAHGWYPQLAIKRRFKLQGAAEENFIHALKEFFATIDPMTISTGALIQPERMPVRVIEIMNQDELKRLHENILRTFGAEITSRYPDREGENYYPHITAEYDDKFVIPFDEYINKTFPLDNVWLLKDTADGDSRAFAKIL